MEKQQVEDKVIKTLMTDKTVKSGQEHIPDFRHWFSLKFEDHDHQCLLAGHMLMMQELTMQNYIYSLRWFLEANFVTGLYLQAFHTCIEITDVKSLTS